MAGDTARTRTDLLGRLKYARGYNAQDSRDVLLSLGTPGFAARTTSDADDIMWDGDLAGLTEQTVSGTATWTEQQGVLSAVVNNTTSNDVSAVLKAVTFAIGDEWVLPVLGLMNWDTANGSTSVGICFTDGTTTSSNIVIGHLQAANFQTGTTLADYSTIAVGRHGTMTAVTTAPWVSDARGFHRQFPLFIKLKYSAANTFILTFSPDGITYSAFGEANISKTMTPTHVGATAWCSDAVDGIVTVGPLTKVA